MTRLPSALQMMAKFYLFRRSMGEYYAVTSVVYGISVVTEDNVYQYRDGELYDVSPDGSVFARMAPVSPDEASTEIARCEIERTFALEYPWPGLFVGWR